MNKLLAILALWITVAPFCLAQMQMDRINVKGINSTGSITTTQKGAVTAAQPGTPNLGTECTSLKGDLQSYGIAFQATDSSNGSHQVICVSKEGGIFFPLVWWNPHYDGVSVDGGGVGNYFFMGTTFTIQHVSAPDFVAFMPMGDSSNNRASIWAENPLINVCLNAPNTCVDAQAWVSEFDMNNAQSEAQNHAFPFVASLHKIGIEVESGGVNRITAYAFMNQTQRQISGAFDGINMAGVSNNAFVYTWKSIGAVLYLNFRSTTTVGSTGSATVTVTCDSPTNPCSTIPTTGMATAQSHGVSLLISQGQADEEYIDPPNWSVPGNTTITATFNKTHVQPFTINLAAYPVKGISMGDPAAYASSAPGFFRQFRTDGDGLVIQRRSDQVNTGSLFKAITVAGANLALLDANGAWQAAAFQATGAGQAFNGLFRLTSTQTINWRNNAGTADIALGKDGFDVLNYAGIPTTLWVTADQTITAGASLTAIPGLSFTLPASAALKVPVSCHLMYSQATAAASDSFGVQDVTVAPTNLAAKAVAYLSTSTFTAGNLPTLTTTTATAVVTFTPSVSATVFNADMDVLIEQPSNASTSVFQIMGQFTTNNGTIKRGSFCKVF